MGKRALPPGVKCLRRSITAPPAEWVRWERRAAEFAREGKTALATVSGAIRADAHAAKRLRHDLRTPLSAIMGGEFAVRDGAMDVPEFLDLVRRCTEEMKGLLKDD
jgi:signal transduction histidine kinase